MPHPGAGAPTGHTDSLHQGAHWCPTQGLGPQPATQIRSTRSLIGAPPRGWGPNQPHRFAPPGRSYAAVQRRGDVLDHNTEATAAERIRSAAVLVREVRPEEYTRAGQIIVAAYAALPGQHMSGGYAAELADVARRSIEAEVLVALEDHLMGCVTFVPDSSSPWAEALGPDEAAIRMLGVDPAAQGRGAGVRLVDACIERARSLGRSGLFLHSTPWMTSAHRLYERAGFRRVPDRDWIPIPEVPLLAFLLDLDRDAPTVLHPPRT